MLVDTSKEKVYVNELVGQKSDVFIAEGDVIVNDIKPDILNVINTNGTICVYKKEVMDGKVRLDGSINIYIMYLADDESGSVRSLNTTLDFTQIVDLDKCRANMKLDDTVTLKSIECKVLNSRKINLKAFIDTNIKIYSNEEIEIVKDVQETNDIQTLKDSLEINSLTGIGVTKVYAKDSVTIDNIDNLAEILKVNISIINKDIKISYNKVLAKSDMEIKIMYLTEDNRINCIDEKIPIMGFIDIENINDNNICDIKYKLNNIVVKPNNSEEHSIYVEAEFELSCYAYEKKDIEFIKDMYSPVDELCFKQKDIETMTRKENIKEICSIREEISVPEIIDNKIYDVEVMPIINRADIQNGKILYDGEINLKVVFAADNINKLDIKIIKLPFKFNIDSEKINSSDIMNTNIEVKTQNFVVLPGGYINSTIELEFNVEISKKQRINIIDEIMIEEKRQDDEYSIIIYFVKEGDTLWNIAKTFKSTIKDIVVVNELEDSEKIYTGMQLFIPRYTKRISA